LIDHEQRLQTLICWAADHGHGRLRCLDRRIAAAPGIAERRPKVVGNRGALQLADFDERLVAEVRIEASDAEDIGSGDVVDNDLAGDADRGDLRYPLT
jgi:hypothetical protein